MRIKKSFVIATAAVLALSVAAGCSGGSEKAVPTTTTSTTLAIALPADQVSMQGRGTLTLDDLGVGWIGPNINGIDLHPAEETGGTCNGPNRKATMLGNIGLSSYNYHKDDLQEDLFKFETYVFPTVAASKAAFARTTGSYGCSWISESFTKSVSILPAFPSVSDSQASRERWVYGPDSCSADRTIYIIDTLVVRVGAQIFFFEDRLFTYGYPSFPSDCVRGPNNPIPPDTAQLFRLAQQAIDKYNAELKQYTKEVYAALATTTSTTKPKKDSSK